MKRATVKTLNQLTGDLGGGGGFITRLVSVNACVAACRDALATDAEVRALRAEVRRLRRTGTECMRAYLAFECDGESGCDCCVCAFAAALAPAKPRGKR